MLRSARAIVITSVVAAWLSGTSAPAAAAARKVVVVALVDGAAPRASRQLERALRAQFSDLALTFRVERVERLPPRTPERLRLARAVAKRHGAIAVLWHDAGPQLYLYFASSSADRLLVRSVDAHGSTERYEALALLARGHLRTMLAGG
ncbi:MAG: hypothetical protein KC503_42665, partial [Myxococcales bacterium]|nr:hypothetical protein [Myxococcales bacterium]